MTSDLTVLHHAPSWLPQTQTWIHGQVSELQRLGVDTHVLCERTENLDQFPVANLHSLADHPRFQQLLDKGLRLLRLRRHSAHLVPTGRRIGAQVLHSHFGHVGWSDLDVARKLGTRQVVTFYGMDVNQLPTHHPVWKNRYLELFAHCDLVLCEGQHMGRCIAALGCPPAKIRVQHLGVAVDRIEFQPRQLGQDETLRILIAASFREKKGIPDAIAALGLLHCERPIALTLIGDAGSDRASRREKQRILAALQKSGLAPHTRLLGYQPHATFLHEASRHHLFLSPSVTASDGDTEGGAPVALIEMAASGMPIVSTTHCDIPEVVRHGTTGLLAAEHDIEGLCQHVRWWRDHPADWQSMLTAGRRHIELEYDLHTQGKKLLALYRSLITSPP